MNYGAILLGLLAVVLIALGFNGTYNDLWETFFGQKLHPIDTSGDGGGNGTYSTPINTPPSNVFQPPSGSEPVTPTFPIPTPGPIAAPIQTGNPVFPGPIKGEPIGPGQINWKGFFGNP